MNILIYDDHNFVTEAIAQYITQHTDEHIVDRCHTVVDVKNSLRYNEVDILISDVLSDEDAGFSLFEYVVKKYPHIKIIIYSSISNKFIIQSLLDMGVSEVVSKKETIENLWFIIQKNLALHVTKTKNTSLPPKLTNREKEIVLHLAKGLSAKEIADTLGSSPSTINNQKNTLLEKYDCLNSTELVVKLSQLGLIGVL